MKVNWVSVIVLDMFEGNDNIGKHIVYAEWEDGTPLTEDERILLEVYSPHLIE